MSLLDVRDLTVSFGRNQAPVVRGVSFSLEPGECLALVGESGSGKSVTARSLLGLAGARARVTADRLVVAGQDATGYGRREWQALRGRSVGMVSQDALVSLDPLRRIGAEVEEPIRLHLGLTPVSRRDRVLELLRDAGIPDAEARQAQYPHELSGGLRQRALIASAVAAEPDVLIADEPTTALDVLVQQQILDLLGRLKAAGRGVLLISHDLAVVASLADRIAVLRHGSVVESGPTRWLLHSPAHPYTRLLLDSVPRPRSGPVDGARGDELVRVEGVRKTYGRSRTTAVDDVSLSLHAGETVGVVGESGSGKSTLAKIVLGLLPPDAGSVTLDGQAWSGVTERQRRGRRRHIQLINQDPYAAFDPRFTVQRIVGEALSDTPRRDRADRVRVLLGKVGLGPEFAVRRPHQLSGGQRQRVAIARALAPEPRVLVCDEPVSALDVSVQAQVLDLLSRLQRETGVAILFITHDLGVARQVGDRVLIMKDGRVVEAGPLSDVFESPRHEFSRALLAAVPRLPDAVSS